MNTSDDSMKSVIEHFYYWEKHHPERIFLRQPVGKNWQTLTFGEAGQQARKMASALQASGLQRGDHVGIYSKNCMHWVLADLAIMMAGLVSVPFYASLPKPQLAEVIELSNIKLLFVGRLQAWADHSEAIPDNVDVIRFPHYAGDAQVTHGQDWDDVIAKHAAIATNFAPDLDDLWTIKFTSGTTGKPKGVMHTHRSPSLIMENERKTGWIGLYNLPTISYLSFLPLNHVGERMGVEVPAITLGGTISFAENLESFRHNIVDTQPTILFAVPRIWSKFHLGLSAKFPIEKLDKLLKIPVLSSILKRKLRAAIGLRDVKVAATGAAITPAFIKEYFHRLDIHLIEAYGMTEVCGSITNGPDLDSPDDSVGKVIPFAQVKIEPTTGEILMKSPYMMKGYYNSPEKTEEVLVDGWLHSGDRGDIDSDGYVRVTGRVKDAFKTAKGSFVTPNPLEEVIMKNEYVEQVCVVGLGIPQPIVLVNLSEQAKTQDRQVVARSLQSTVEGLNNTRANFEKVSTAVVQQEAWSEMNGFLTPTMKVKRGEIDIAFGRQYLEWHQAPDSVIWC